MTGSSAPAGTFQLRAYWLSAPSLAAVFDALEPVAPVRVVGGAVRNALMGEPISDVDLATEAVPEAVAKAAHAAGLRVHETGIEHGTLTLVSQKVAYEVTTLREDVTTDGRRATVSFTRDWARDAARRDFTMNALYVDRFGDGIDFTGGYADCLARRVRFIGDADQRILEDHLRILRFFRFNAAYGNGAMDKVGLDASRRHKARIGALAVERICHELMRTVVAPNAAAVLRLVGEEDFLPGLLPGPYEIDTFTALVALERRIGRQPTPPLAIAALLGFDREAFEVAATALRFSRRDRARALDAIAAARFMPPHSLPQIHASLYEHGAEAFVDGLLVGAACGADLVDLPRLVEVARQWRRPRLPVSGNDLLEQGGEAGPELGERLKHLEGVWRQSDFSLDKMHLLAIDRRSRSGKE
ncbi:CCA tRNA nucleotidyltransferase [Acuticoccus sp. I52.16.1]|uniref:CCA tRNA nucleotidyltransferase n=1 Tax=Acuticoccus sp. I52.16.1 TaxID=2928472 RepID=UPI001FD2F453|nr:CCA tRNA nucleotidyltransferase [Acuticoccus sp. I52.16.1]UOM35535.1 CCA tRNA nucleotidyltransferase [Acuticoccus sp. I52.16.1]